MIKDRKIELVGYPENVEAEKIARYIEINYKKLKYAYCVHNADKKENGEPKATHYHFVIWSDTPFTLTKLLTDLDIPERWLEKIRNKKNAIRYLIHLDHPEKFQYDRNEIVTNDIRYISECLDEISYRDNGYIIDETFEKSYNKQHNEIYNLQIDQTKKMKLFELLEKFFNHYCIEINSNGANREMEIYYIQGATGTGKTSFAKQMCDSLKYDYCVSSSSNDPLQDYRGQKALILDDFRTDNMKFSDLLKLTDPYTNSSVKSRYSNKYMVGCKVIFITSIIPLDKIYIDTTQYQDTKMQFYRRITNVIVTEKNEFGKMIAKMYFTFNRETGTPYGDYAIIPVNIKKTLEQSKSQMEIYAEQIQAEIAKLTPEQKDELFEELPKQLKNISLYDCLPFGNDDDQQKPTK